MARTNLALLLTILAVVVPASHCEASLVLVDGNFEGTQTDFITIDDNSEATTGVWHKSSGFSQVSTGFGTNTTNIMMRSSTFTGFAQSDRRHFAAYQFLDATDASGTYQLDFEYYNDDIGSSIASRDSIAYLNVYGITGSTWTTTSNFVNFANRPQSETMLPTPVISGATITSLGAFADTSQTDQWQSGTLQFDLGAGGFDTVAVRLGARFHVTGPSRTAFDNVSLTATAVPEASSAITFGVFAFSIAGFRRRKLQNRAA
ncbi:MAG: hypothetical protein WBD31_00275 [Rubripirellula sp.]